MMTKREEPPQLKLRKLELEINQLRGKLPLYDEALKILLSITVNSAVDLHVTDPLIIKRLKDCIKILEV